MTPEQHNKYLGVAHLAYASILAVFILSFLAMFGVIFSLAANESARAGQQAMPPFVFFLVIWLFFAAIYGAFLVPSFVAGYALLKRKRWAKIAAIIAAVVAAMFAPFGTAVSVYTFWFLFSEPGRLLYDTPTQALPPPRLGETIDQRDLQPTAYDKPPDWR